VFKSVHVCVIYKCKHWTLVEDFSNGNQPLTGFTEYTARICMPKESRDGSHVSNGKYTVVYRSSGTTSITSLCHRDELRAYILITAKMCSVLNIFFRLMQVYVIARNEDSTGQNVTFHSGLRLEEDDYVI
jgi:hypothetical protein